MRLQLSQLKPLLILATVVVLISGFTMVILMHGHVRHEKTINELTRQLNQAQTTSDSLRKHCK